MFSANDCFGALPYTTAENLQILAVIPRDQFLLSWNLGFSDLLIYYSRRRSSSLGSGAVALFLSVCVCVFVYLCVHTLKEKRLELSTPNLVHAQCMAVARHALTPRSKGQRSRSRGYACR